MLEQLHDIEKKMDNQFLSSDHILKRIFLIACLRGFFKFFFAVQTDIFNMCFFSFFCSFLVEESAHHSNENKDDYHRVKLQK